MKKTKEVTEGKAPIKRRRLSHVLTIDDDFYITCDSKTYILKERVDGIDKKGKKIPDKCIAFATELQDILGCCARRMIKVPANFDELIKHMEHIYGLLDARIPANCKPRDLFKDMEDNNED